MNSFKVVLPVVEGHRQIVASCTVGSCVNTHGEAMRLLG